MRINGIDIDDIDPKTLKKKDVRVYEEGKRLKVKELWVDSYIYVNRDGCVGVEYCAHKLTLNNYGTVTLDDKPVRDPKEIKIVKELFDQIKV